VGEDAALEEGVEFGLAGRAGPKARPLARHKQSPGLFVSGLGLTNCGSSLPVLASAWAMKLAACSCTRRYSVVCSGRWRS
jgi:hypothetical protein